MTAFAGIVYPDALQVSDITDLMLQPLEYRAGNAKQVLTFRNIQLGCIGRNLISNHKHDLHLAFDGSISTITGLAEECKGADQEERARLILKAYEMHGASFVEMIKGEFALALLDQKQGTLILARDRIGKKPLYWCQEKKYFIFGSEIKALLASGLIPQTPSQEALAAYLYFGYSPQDLTPIQGVNKLLPAHALHFSLQQGVQIHTYWSYSSLFEKRVHLHKTQVLGEINQLMEAAVECMMPKGPAGCFVSGGLGSATVAYYLTQQKPLSELKAFTAAFKDATEEDMIAAKSACNSLGLDQETGIVTPELFLSDFPKIIWALDEPVGDPNVLATYKLASMAQSYAPTVFSGMGSDELLAVHSRYSLAERDSAYVSKLMLLPRPLIQKILIPFLKIFYPQAAYNVLRSMRTNPWQFEYLRHNALFDETSLKEASPRLAACFDPDTFLHKFHHLSRVHSLVSSFLYFDVKTRLPDCFILQYERMTRAHKLNWKTPFLYHPLIEYTAQLPEPERLLEKDTGSYLKPLLKDVFSEAFVNRPKKTRKHFLASWIDHPEVLEAFRHLEHGTLVDTGVISDEWIAQCLSSKESTLDSFSKLFAVLTLEVWFKLFMNRQPSTTSPSTSLIELLQSR